MDISKLPDISSVLVTADNPARGGSLGMDHERCAALHNYLLHYAWIAEGRPLAVLEKNNNTFFTTHAAAADILRPRLHPSLAAFLAAAMLPPDGFDRAPFFFWASEICSPNGEVFAEFTADLFDEPADSLVYLYSPNIGQGGEAAAAYSTIKAAIALLCLCTWTISTLRYPSKRTESFGIHLRLCFPTGLTWFVWVKSRLLPLRRRPCSTARRLDHGSGDHIAKPKFLPVSTRGIGCARQSRRASRFCFRLAPAPIRSLQSHCSHQPSWMQPRCPSLALCAPFLSSARRPEFCYIAPGLLLPPADASEFTAAQPFTGLPRDHHVIPPVCLFPANRGEREVDIQGTRSLFHGGGYYYAATRLADSSLPSQIAAGIYSQPVDRRCYDNAEEGFQLLLPYGFEDKWDDNGLCARKSDGSPVSGYTSGTSMLFQHGYKPFGGDYYRPQRLERLFDCWYKLIDQGVWSVGPRGVEGMIDTFKEANTELWRHYAIPPTW